MMNKKLLPSIDVERILALPSNIFPTQTKSDPPREEIPSKKIF